jgi:hypothetical protein
MTDARSECIRHCLGASRGALGLDRRSARTRCDTCDNCDTVFREGPTVATVATVARGRGKVAEQERRSSAAPTLAAERVESAAGCMGRSSALHPLPQSDPHREVPVGVARRATGGEGLLPIHAGEGETMLWIRPQAGGSRADTGPGALALSRGMAGEIARLTPPFIEAGVRVEMQRY